jgi:hypothetical protein
MVTALAFVPPTLISKAFEELSASLSHNNTYTLLLKWFEENFIGKEVFKRLSNIFKANA